MASGPARGDGQERGGTLPPGRLAAARASGRARRRAPAETGRPHRRRAAGKAPDLRRLAPLRGQRHLPKPLRVDLGLALERKQPVVLLLDVGELRVAKALDWPGLHQRLDHFFVRLEELAGVGYALIPHLPA